MVKQRSFCHDLRRYVREYNEVTGIHGVRYLTEKRSTTEKVFWAIIILISLVGCTYMIFETVRKYQNSPVVVSFASKETPVYEIPFPSVTICPEAKSSGNKFNFTDVQVKIYQKEFQDLNETQLKQYRYISALCEDSAQLPDNKTVDSDDFFRTISELAPETVMDVYIGNDYLGDQTLLTPVIIDEGVCYAFNILDRTEIFRDHVAQYKKFYQVNNDSRHFNTKSGYDEDAGVDTYPIRALMSGAENALQIYVMYNSNDTDYNCTSFLQGFRVLIHNPWDVPHLTNHHFWIPLDQSIVAAVDPQMTTTSQEVKKFSPEKRECYMEDERPLKHFKVYTQSNCLFECLTNYTLEKCDCVDYFMPRENSTAICGSQSYTCTEKAKNELKLNDLVHKVTGDKTYCDCKPQCDSLKYRVEISHSDFYWREFFNVQKKLGIAVREHEYSQEIHWSVLSIYLKEEQFTTLERNELFAVTDLISNFGGLLGLFTGFSLISLAEIVYFLTMRIYYNRRLYRNWAGPQV